MVPHSPPLSRRSLVALGALLGGSLATNRLLPDVALSREATPVTGSGWNESILHRAFDAASLLIDEPAVIATFADLERQMIATGVARPPRNPTAEELEHWLSAIYALRLPRAFEAPAYARNPEFRVLTGFGIEDVHQSAMIDSLMNVVTLYAGIFDRETVLTTWRNAGYHEVASASSDTAIRSVSEDGLIDWDIPVQRVFAHHHSNAALIGNELVIFAATLDRLTKAIATAKGEVTSLGANPGVALLLAATPPLAGGMLLTGSQIMAPVFPFSDDSDTDDGITIVVGGTVEVGTEGQMPPVRLALIGITGGGPIPYRDAPFAAATPLPTPELARMEIALLLSSIADAEQAIAVAAQRLERGSTPRDQLYREAFASWDLWVTEHAPVARISFEFGEAWPHIWSEMVSAGGLGFIG